MIVAVGLIGVIVGLGVAQEVVKVDAALPLYKAVGGISGNLSSIGSDTLNNLMTLWAEGFNKLYP
ncbi:MAG: phosphate-binding protein, partial [Candidatus Latescibacteria bacterium]|nr:phosphate-binding protein [Candidatus Latescibacterota bacterium]